MTEAPAGTSRGERRWIATLLKGICVGGFVAIGAIVWAWRERSSYIELSAQPLRLEDGSWDLDVIEECCRLGLEAHGVEPSDAIQVDYGDQRIGENRGNPDRALTAWTVGPESHRVYVSLTLEGDAIHCSVNDGK